MNSRPVSLRRLAVACLLTAVAWIAYQAAAAPGDEEGIRQAVLDYANSAYLVQPELVDRSVHPHLQKVGYVQREGQGYAEHWMNFYELKELVSAWNKEGRFDPKTAKREVMILDRLDQTAVARLDAEWGIDFFHLAKIDGRWMILNVIWQTVPPAAGATATQR